MDQIQNSKVILFSCLIHMISHSLNSEDYIFFLFVELDFASAVALKTCFSFKSMELYLSGLFDQALVKMIVSKRIRLNGCGMIIEISFACSGLMTS